MRRDPSVVRDGALRRRHSPALEAELDRLEAADIDALATIWEARHGTPPPAALPLRLLRLALAHDLQARLSGGLSRATERRLDRLANGSDRKRTARPASLKLKGGARLLRDWGGRTWRVDVESDGCFYFEGRRWRSLSAIARAITGTSRNGPAFFGLRPGGGNGRT